MDNTVKSVNQKIEELGVELETVRRESREEGVRRKKVEGKLVVRLDKAEEEGVKIKEHTNRLETEVTTERDHVRKSVTVLEGEVGRVEEIVGKSDKSVREEIDITRDRVGQVGQGSMDLDLHVDNDSSGKKRTSTKLVR